MIPYEENGPTAPNVSTPPVDADAQTVRSLDIPSAPAGLEHPQTADALINIGARVRQQQDPLERRVADLRRDVAKREEETRANLQKLVVLTKDLPEFAGLDAMWQDTLEALQTVSDDVPAWTREPITVPMWITRQVLDELEREVAERTDHFARHCTQVEATCNRLVGKEESDEEPPLHFAFTRLRGGLQLSQKKINERRDALVIFMQRLDVAMPKEPAELNSVEHASVQAQVAAFVGVLFIAIEEVAMCMQLFFETHSACAQAKKPLNDQLWEMAKAADAKKKATTGHCCSVGPIPSSLYTSQNVLNEVKKFDLKMTIDDIGGYLDQLQKDYKNQQPSPQNPFGVGLGYKKQLFYKRTNTRWSLTEEEFHIACRYIQVECTKHHKVRRPNRAPKAPKVGSKGNLRSGSEL